MRHGTEHTSVQKRELGLLQASVRDTLLRLLSDTIVLGCFAEYYTDTCTESIGGSRSQSFMGSP